MFAPNKKKTAQNKPHQLDKTEVPYCLERVLKAEKNLPNMFIILTSMFIFSSFNSSLTAIPFNKAENIAVCHLVGHPLCKKC